MEELNYKNISFINEIDILKINNKNIFVINNYSYFYIYYLDNLGKVKINIYDLNEINKNIFINIINNFNNKKIYISGKNYLELIQILEKNKLDYYFFEKNDNLLIDLYLQNKMYN